MADEYVPVAQCHGCQRLRDGRCTVYAFPAARWRVGGGCPLATHVRRVRAEDVSRLNPLKASKRSVARRRK